MRALCCSSPCPIYLYAVYIYLLWQESMGPGTCAHMPALALPSCHGRAALALDLLLPFSFAQFAAIAPSSSSRCRARGGFSQVGTRPAALAPILPAGRKPWGARRTWGSSGDQRALPLVGSPPLRDTRLLLWGVPGQELSSPPQLQYRPCSHPRQQEARGPNCCPPKPCPGNGRGREHQPRAELRLNPSSTMLFPPVNADDVC